MEMKKEIKKLQRLRDFFRANLNNSDIKDKTKLNEAKRRVETVSQSLIKDHQNPGVQSPA
jgi:CCR4-NOT transcriptional regulation complex NOT5 subunit